VTRWRPWTDPRTGKREAFPSLGGQLTDWISFHLPVPDGPLIGEPLNLTAEQQLFMLRLYELDPRWIGPVIKGAALNQARLITRAVLSRVKGWGKSPLLAALCICEGTAPVLLDHWSTEDPDVDTIWGYDPRDPDAEWGPFVAPAGWPVARRWDSLGFRAKTQVIATSEDQTSNTWEPLLDMVRSGSFLDCPCRCGQGVEPMETFVKLPRGRIEYATSAADSREGGRPVFAVFDQTESWTKSNGGIKLAESIRRNLTKTGGCSVETPNAYLPGLDSVAELSFKAAEAQKTGRTQLEKTTILLDHRQAPLDVDITDRADLIRGIELAYGDSLDKRGGWVVAERVADDFWDPDVDPATARMYFLGQVTAAARAWLQPFDWSGCFDGDAHVADGDAITLGFDGSQRRARGMVDSTALIGCHVRTNHVFTLGIWQQPYTAAGLKKDWEPPRVEIDAAVRAAFSRYRVLGFFCDPARWLDEVSRWEEAYGRRLVVKANVQHPCQWWFSGRTVPIVKMYQHAYSAIVERQMTHDGDHLLTQHVLNSRTMDTPHGVILAKEFPESRNKIDAAVAMSLAMWARQEAVAKGFDREKPKRRSYGFS
jgi:hypothetical protein